MGSHQREENYNFLLLQYGFCTGILSKEYHIEITCVCVCVCMCMYIHSYSGEILQRLPQLVIKVNINSDNSCCYVICTLNIMSYNFTSIPPLKYPQTHRNQTKTLDKLKLKDFAKYLTIIFKIMSIIKNRVSLRNCQNLEKSKT